MFQTQRLGFPSITNKEGGYADSEEGCADLGGGSAYSEEGCGD